MDTGAPRERRDGGFLRNVMPLCQWRQEIDPCRRFGMVPVGELKVCNRHVKDATKLRRELREAAQGLQEYLGETISSP